MSNQDTLEYDTHMHDVIPSVSEYMVYICANQSSYFLKVHKQKHACLYERVEAQVG